MNIRELIEALESIAEDYGDDVDVHIAEQPSWPFENEINGVEVVDFSKGEPCEMCDGKGKAGGEECENCNGTGNYKEEGEEGEKVAYLVEGRQIGYLPGAASKTLGWR